MNELNRLQRKLIPVNIVVAVLALVAAITIIFAPLLTIDVGKAAPAVVELMMGDDSDSGSEGSEGGNGGTDNIMKSVVSMVGNMKISISTFNLAQFAFSADPFVYITEAAAEQIKDMEDEIFSTVVTEMLPAIVEETDMDIDTDNIDVKEIMTKFDEITKAKTDEEVTEAIADLVDSVQNMVKTTDGEKLIPDEAKEQISEMIKEFYDAAKEELGDEDLTLESFICVTISKMMGEGFSGNGGEEGAVAMRAAAAAAPAEGSGSSDGESSGKIYTNYKDLLAGFMGLDSSSEGGEDGMEQMKVSIQAYLDIVKYFVYVMFFFAGIWFIQFLFALLHIFLKNKRFTMWYTKLFGFFPCLIFGVLPLVAGAVLPMLIPEMAEVFGIVLGAVSSLTWISGGCYIALWLISIFWAFPIKRKIRRELKNGATY